MQRSESIGKLAEALSKAQGAMKGAKKDSENPFFKSKYADLASVWDACREPLSLNGLAIMQLTEREPSGEVAVETVLTHSSGEWMSSRVTMKALKDDPQGIGSCISYARRYALAAMVGVYQEDDDANAASQAGAKKETARPSQDAPRAVEPPAARESAPPDGAVISEAQGKRFYAIAKGAGWKDDEIKAALKATIGADSTKTILRTRYDAACELMKNGPPSKYASNAPPDKDGERFRNALYDLVIEEVAGDMLEIEPYLRTLTGKATVKELSVEQAKKAIEQIQGQQKARVA